MKRHVGIDLSKRSMEVAFIDDQDKISRSKFKNTFEGRLQLISFLKKEDFVALETGNASFLLASLILEKVGCRVYVLNAGKLHVIFQSMVKTDKEDSLKLAKFIKWTPEANLPVVTLPNEKEMQMRSSIVEQVRIVNTRTRSINALHNIFWNAGITHLKRRDFQDNGKRKSALKELPSRYQKQAARIEEQIDLCDSQLSSIEEEQTAMLKENLEQSMISMSMPGVGPKTALAIQAFMGDMSRFSHSRQVSHFSGFTPRRDDSGDQHHNGHISKAGPNLLRRVMVQAAWATLKSKDGTEFQEFYKRILKKRSSHKIAIVALARKMLEIQYILHTQKTFYRSLTESTLYKLYRYQILSKEEYRALTKSVFGDK